MESKKINQLATNLAPVNTDLTVIGDPVTGELKKITLLQIASLFGAGLTSVGMVVPSGFSVSPASLTSSGTFTITGAGTTDQYIDGTGALQTFPTLLNSDKLIHIVRNNSGATILKGTIVYINGALGNKPTIAKALATSDATSAQTYGVVQADILNNADGNIVVIGDVENLDTSAVTEGTQLYLSGTTAGAYTTTKPYAPIHLVYVAIVLRSHPTLGIIGVKIQNGYEMDELHNVSAQSPSNNDGLFWNSTTSLWEKNTIAGVLGYTPVTSARTISTTSPLSGGGDLSANRTLSIAQATTSASGYLSSTDWNTFNNKQSTITLTVTGSSGASTFSAGTLNIPTYTLSGLGGQPLATNLTNLSGLTFVSTSFVKMTASGTFGLDTNTYYLASNPSGYTSNVGTVTSVAALTLGTTGTDLSSSVATGTSTPVITLNVPTASATNRGVLSSSDWSAFNSKQGAITLTTTGSSGSATLVTNTLNIPTYTLAGLGGQASSTNLTSLSGLTYVSASFVKMTASGTFSLDTSTYLTANQTITLSGDVTGSGSTSITTAIGTNKVTNAMLAQIATASFHGRVTAGTGNVETLSGTQATTLLDTFTSLLKGLVPASGGGTTNFLRADGTWAAPATGGTGTVTSVAMTVPTGLSIAGSPITMSGTLALTLTAGYSIPTTTSQTNWDTAYTNRITSLTTTGSSGSATLTTNTLNIPTYTLAGLGGQASSTNLTSLSGLTYVSASFVKMTAAGTFSLDTSTYYLASNPSGYTNNTGTVTSVAALTLGTTGTDLSSSVATGTTTPVITLNVPTASATNRGALSSTDWSTFNSKQGAITLTTTGTSGAATLIGTTLNIPQYSGTNIYNADGTLTSARTVTQGANNLTFTGSRTSGNNLAISLTQTSPNATDTGDSTLSVGYTLLSTATTNQLVSRAFSFTATNSLTGAGSSITNLRVVDIQGVTSASSTTTNLDMIYILGGASASGTVTSSRGLYVRNLQGTSQAGVVLEDLSATSTNYTGLVLYSTNGAIPTGDYGIYQYGASLVSYFEGFITANKFTKIGGTSSQFLKADGSVDSSTYSTFVLPTLTSGSVLFSDGTTISQNNAAFFWDNTNSRLGLGTTSPQFNIHSTGSIRGNALFSATNITIGGTTAATTSSLVDIISTTKGVLFPRMTNAQLTAIATPATGLIAYATDATEGLYVKLSGGFQRFLTTADGNIYTTNGTLTSARTITANGFGLTYSDNKNGQASITISNTTAGTTSASGLIMTSDATSGNGLIAKISSTYTTSAIVTASDTALINYTAGDISLLNSFASGKIKFGVGTSTSAQMTLTNDGHLLIGTTTNGTYFLDVNGDINVTGKVNIAAGTTTRSPLDFTVTGAVLKTSPIAGDLEVDADGYGYYTFNASERGVILAEQWIKQTSDYTFGTSITTAQKIFNASTNGTVTLKGSTTYYFECFFNMTGLSATTTNGWFGFALGGTATLTSIAWQSFAQKTTGPTTPGSAQQTINITASNSNISNATGNAGTSGFAFIKGTVRTNAAGTFIPQVILGVGALATVKADSYFRITAQGTAATQSIGNWS